MHLIELYKSVQGESSFTGLPCIFVRFAGCNLRCAWCDSEYTFSGGKPFTQAEVIAQSEALAPCKLVEFTGGEPMLQARELLPLMDELLRRGYTLMMETSGERPLDLVPKAVHKIVDVKCPGAGSAANSFRIENLAALTPNDEIKFVLTDRADYNFARAFIAEHDLRAKVGGILFSPAFSKSPSPLRTVDNATLDPRTLVEWMMADGVDARLSLQIHKFIWEPMKKGRLVMAIFVRAVIVAAFEPDSGAIPGELRYFRERENLIHELPFPQGYRPLWLNDDGVLGIVAGVGAARAAASVMALGLDPRFDLSEALWLITGVAGIDPTRGSLASVVLPEYVVDGALAHELDGRQIPSDWPDGFVPIGKSTPYEQPLEARFNGDDGIVFRLDPDVVAWAFDLACEVELLDSAKMAARRRQFSPAAAQQTPQALRGDELSSTTFWHGKLLNHRAQRWVQYQTSGCGSYVITAMEDTGILQSLTFLAAAGRVDFAKVLVVRAASNYDQEREGISAAESLAETRVATYSAYLPALENAWRVGRRILSRLAG